MKKQMRFYLSYGGGVGSEALRLWLLEHKWPFEAVYVDTECDWPETQEFVKTVPNLTILKPKVNGYSNLYDYCLHYEMVPSFMRRWCTDEFKIRTMYRYFKRPCIVYIGFTIDEAWRAHNSQCKDIFNQFPFISTLMTRSDCKEYIKSLKMPVPMRSSCWFCPYQKKDQWKMLRRLHPDLYEKAKYLEKINMDYRKSIGKTPLTIHASGKRLDILVEERQLTLFKEII